MRTLFLVAASAAVLAAGCSRSSETQTAAAPAAAPAADTADAGPTQGRGPGFGEPQTLDDMLKRTMARFDRLDGDNDGRVTEDEREAARAARQSQGGPGGGPGGGRGFGGGFGRADADGDGVITRAEVEAQTRGRFARLDANKDGTVTPDEMQAAFAAFRGRGQGGGDGN